MGLTDLYLHSHLENQTYYQHFQHYAAEAERFQKDGAARSESAFDGHVAVEDELKFLLYRHWNLYDSMRYSQYLASRLASWKEQGEKKLNTMLVKMGTLHVSQKLLCGC